MLVLLDCCIILFYSTTTRSIATANPTQTIFQSMAEVFSLGFLILVSVVDSHYVLTERKQIDNELVFVFCLFVVHAIESHCILSRIVTLLILIPFILPGFEITLLDVAQIPAVEAIVSIITITIIESLIILIRQLLALSFQSSFHRNRLHSVLTQQKRGGLAISGDIKIIVAALIVITANATIVINLRECASKWFISKNFDIVTTNVEATIEANTANVESVILAIAIKITRNTKNTFNINTNNNGINPNSDLKMEIYFAMINRDGILMQGNLRVTISRRKI